MKTTYFNLRCLSIILIISSIFGPITHAINNEVVNPQAVIENVLEKLQEKFEDQEFMDDRDRIDTFVDKEIAPHVDFDRISRIVLGKLWKKATQDEREEFTREFTLFFSRIYLPLLMQPKDWSIRFYPMNIKEGATKTIVKSIVLKPHTQPINLDYRMVLSEDKWKIYDFMLEGVSTVTNYRNSIKHIFNTTRSIRGVIDTVIEKNMR